jgi:hypothetical protein
MSYKYYDVIIIGSGIAGLYAAYNIKKKSPTTTFLVLEKHKKEWIGGRTSNETFYDTEIVTGAGVGRKAKDKLLLKLVREIGLDVCEYDIKPNYSHTIHTININEAFNTLKSALQKYKGPPITFKNFAINILGKDKYKQFLVTNGYTDYENEDVYETIYNYGMEDNNFTWTAFQIHWKTLVNKLEKFIGVNNFKFSNNVNKVTKIQDVPCVFLVQTDKGNTYLCNKIIVAGTINTIKQLFPKKSIYNEIDAQPFLRLYAKFSKSSISIMDNYVKGLTITNFPLQKIVPVNKEKGVYMIAYCDNKSATTLSKHLENNEDNRELYCRLVEKSLGIPNDTLNIIAIKDFYWKTGTHYFKPLDKKIYPNREKFIEKAQNPEKGILIVGEVVSKNHGWTEGALDSVEKVLTTQWIKQSC